MWRSFITKVVPQSGDTPAAPPTAAPNVPGLPQDQQALAATTESCDYRACSAKYQSFDASDCTYQPYGGGQRQRCEKPAPEAQQANVVPKGVTPSPTAESSSVKGATATSNAAKCNVDVCSASYSSFRASDCTYQPLDGGPRAVCDKGGAGAAQRGSPSSRPRKAVTEAPPSRQDEELPPASEGGSAGDTGLDFPFFYPDNAPDE